MLKPERHTYRSRSESTAPHLGGDEASGQKGLQRRAVGLTQQRPRHLRGVREIDLNQDLDPDSFHTAAPLAPEAEKEDQDIESCSMGVEGV